MSCWGTGHVDARPFPAGDVMQMRTLPGPSLARPTRLPWSALAGLLVAVFALAIYLIPELRSPLADLWAFVDTLDADTLRETLRPLGPWAPFGFLIAQAAQVLVPFLPGAPVTVAGVLLFGWQLGLVLSMAGFMLGSAVQFAAVRRWGRPLVARLAGEAVVTRYAGRLDRRGWWLLAAFLVPFSPADALSAVAALSPISARRFLLISFLGRLPWAAAAVLLAAGLVSGPAVAWAASLGGAIAIGLTAVRWRARAAPEQRRDRPCSRSLCRLRCLHRTVA